MFIYLVKNHIGTYDNPMEGEKTLRENLRQSFGCEPVIIELKDKDQFNKYQTMTKITTTQLLHAFSQALFEPAEEATEYKVIPLQADECQFFRIGDEPTNYVFNENE